MVTKRFIVKKAFWALFILGAFFLASPVFLAADEDASGDAADLQQPSAGAAGVMGSQELIQSKAVQFFILHKYEDALTEFRNLSKQYPKDVSIQRYIGVCLSELRRDEESFIVFDEILRNSPEDLPTHKFLAKMHLRRGETARAKERLEKLVEYDTTEKFSSYAKAQLEKLETIESTKKSGQALTGRQIDPDEFLKTKAAVHFMDAKYEEAVKEFEALEAQYPEDITVKRYKGMALDKLGRFDEAIEAFQEGLKIAPDNAALRYALAQSLFHKKDLRASTEMLRSISARDFGDYKLKADRDLEVLEKIEALILRADGKPWSFGIEQGFEVNSNAASEPTKIQVPAEEHAVRFPGSLSANYRIQKNGPWTLSASYAYFHSFYSDTLDYLNTRVHAPGLTLVHMGSVADKPFVTIFSSNYIHVSVENEYYYQSYPQTLRLVYSFWDSHRIILSEKVAYTDYRDQGLAPTDTSREGLSNTLNVTNNFYFNQKRTLYLGVGYEFKVEDPKGSIYVRNIHQVNTDFNFPMGSDWTGVISFKYKNSDYPETNALIQRLDEEYSAGVRINIPLNQTLTLKLSYDYLNNDSNDPVYGYVNHAGGASLALSF